IVIIDNEEENDILTTDIVIHLRKDINNDENYDDCEDQQHNSKTKR
ncbi:37956_t:CDS:2, partial [Gigaspora margarita]